jgi:hypothetical protein
MGLILDKPKKNPIMYNDYKEHIVDDLKAQGHTCICYLETWPTQISWCGQFICIKQQ